MDSRLRGHDGGFPAQEFQLRLERAAGRFPWRVHRAAPRIRTGRSTFSPHHIEGSAIHAQRRADVLDVRVRRTRSDATSQVARHSHRHHKRAYLPFRARAQVTLSPLLRPWLQ